MVLKCKCNLTVFRLVYNLRAIAAAYGITLGATITSNNYLQFIVVFIIVAPGFLKE